MSKLSKTPSVEQFAKAWTQNFAQAVRDAAGKDGRLSLNEAKKIAKRNDALALWGDNAVNYLEKTGQKSVSVEKLISSGYRYAAGAAARVAGNNRKLSLIEARNLPADLKPDFFRLRGKELPDDAASSVTGAELEQKFDAYCQHLGFDYLGSEGAVPMVGFSLPGNLTTLDVDVFKKAMGLTTDRVEHQISREEKGMDWFDEMVAYVRDAYHDAAEAAEFEKLGNAMKDGLKDIHMFVVGEDDSSYFEEYFWNQPDFEWGTHAAYCVGIAPDGSLAGFKTGVVWT